MYYPRYSCSSMHVYFLTLPSLQFAFFILVCIIKLKLLSMYNELSNTRGMVAQQSKLCLTTFGNIRTAFRILSEGRQNIYLHVHLPRGPPSPPPPPPPPPPPRPPPPPQKKKSYASKVYHNPVFHLGSFEGFHSLPKMAQRLHCNKLYLGSTAEQWY